MRIPVKVFLPSGDIDHGDLTFHEEGPQIDVQGVIYNQSSKDTVSYSIQDYSVFTKECIVNPDQRILLQSKTVLKIINTSVLQQYDMYPPSTRGWINLLSESGKQVLFVLQDLVSNNKKMMTIIDLGMNEIFDCFLVNPYETEILFMEPDWTIYNQIRNIRYDDMSSTISRLLDGPPPSWGTLAKILEGVDVPQLKIKDTMEATMSQLVPKSFPNSTRRELMAFLAWIQDAEVPPNDPLDFAAQITEASVFPSLVFGHIQCMLEKKAPPEYVRIMTMAERGLLLPTLPTAESIEQNKWELAWYKLREIFPNRRENVFEIAEQLNKNQQIVTSLPITRAQASISKKSWIERFALINYSLLIRGFVQNQRIGLNTLVYVGGAHKWPHKHLSWTARLGHPKDKPPFIQVMIMPPTSTEQAIRALPNLSKIEWSTSCFNLNLFDKNRQTWKNRLTRIYSSIQSKRTLRQLEREFPTSSQGPVYVPTRAEVKVLDYISWQMYLSSLEKGDYEDILGVDNIQLLEILTKLRDHEIVKIQYQLRIPGLTSTCHIVEGPREQTQSLVRSFLKHMPSTTAMIEEGGSKAYILSRVPDDSVYDLFVNLPTKALEVDMKVRCLRIDAFAGYQHNLYSRLLKSDQTWDDDISGLLSQIRS